MATLQSIDNTSSDDDSYEFIDAVDNETVVVTSPPVPAKLRHLLQAQEKAEKNMLRALDDFDLIDAPPALPAPIVAPPKQGSPNYAAAILRSHQRRELERVLREQQKQGGNVNVRQALEDFDNFDPTSAPSIPVPSEAMQALLHAQETAEKNVLQSLEDFDAIDAPALPSPIVAPKQGTPKYEDAIMGSVRRVLERIERDERKKQKEAENENVLRALEDFNDIDAPSLPSPVLPALIEGQAEAPSDAQWRRELLEIQEMAEKNLLRGLEDFDNIDAPAFPSEIHPAVPAVYGGQTGAPGSVTSMRFPARVLVDARRHFTTLYERNGRSEESLVNEFLTDFKAFTLSDYFQDRQRAKCMLKMFFDEFPFINEYPTPELRITAMIFGGIVREELIESPDAEAAVRMIVTSLEKEVHSQQWMFGVVALAACEEKLLADHEICVMISGLANFAALPDALKTAVQTTLTGRLPVQIVAQPVADVAPERVEKDAEIASLRELLVQITIEKEILEVELQNEREEKEARADENAYRLLRLLQKAEVQGAEIKEKTAEIARLKDVIAEKI